MLLLYCLIGKLCSEVSFFGEEKILFMVDWPLAGVEEGEVICFLTGVEEGEVICFLTGVE